MVMNIKYRLVSILETEYKFNYDFDFQSINPKSVSMQIGHAMKPAMEEDCITVSMKVNVVHTETNTILATNAISMIFGLSPIKKILSFDSNGSVTTQSSEILDTFITATLGALRGVLMKNLKGTPLSFVVIPLIPIEKLKAASE